MSHESWTDRLSDYLDGDLTPAERADVSRHLEACADCASVLADLRSVVGAARRANEELPPEQDLWPGIRARIGSAPIRLEVTPATGSPDRRGRGTSSTRVRVAAAAAVVLALVGGSFWIGRTTAPATGGLAGVDAPATPTDPGTEIPTAGADAAIAQLERAFAETRVRLDPATVEAIEANLTALDHAADDARFALSREPTSAYLSQHLAYTLQRKVRLLRDVNELAARIE